MTNTMATNIESVLAFLPEEAGLRAHVSRVAALAGHSAQANRLTPAQTETIELAGLLHHYRPDPEAAGAARLFADLNLAVPSHLLPLPERAREVWQLMEESDHDPLLEFVESANLFDEQFENLPYEDRSVGDAVQELIRSGMLSPEFIASLSTFRVISPNKLLECSKGLPVDIPTRRWFPAKSYEAIFAHSMEVAESASLLARHSNSVSEADAYLAGVFHDIGRVAFQSSTVTRHLQDWEKLGFPPVYAEFLVSGTDHAALGAELLRKWDFPKHIAEAVEYHHRLELTSSPLAAVLHVAEDERESLPSCARDHIAAKRLAASELRYGKAAG